MKVAVFGPHPVIRSLISFSCGIKGSFSANVYLKELERLGKSPGDFHFTGFEHTMILCKNQVEYDSVAKQQAQRWGKTVEYVKQNFFLGTHEAIAEKLVMAEGLGLEMMVIYVRPAGSVHEVKDRVSEFKDKVIPLIH